jgi:tetratricopeptide (TPR) repeat protein
MNNPLLSKEENLAVEHNLKGQGLEKQGNIEGAIELYELNVAYVFEGDFPYDRLRIIYSKQKRYDDVIRVLEKAVDVFDNKAFPTRPDRLPKLERFRQQLEQAKIKAKRII